jgi:hypothetical protein
VRETAAVLKLLRRGVLAGILAGGAYAAWRFLAARAPDTAGVTFQTSPFPGPPRPVPSPSPVPAPTAAVAVAPAEVTPAEPAAPSPPVSSNGASPWVEPVDGSCPLTHPVKAKLSSGIFHEPGGGNYDRIRAERCYVDPDAAIADGLRAPKR